MGQVFAMISCGDNQKKLAKLLLDPNSMGEGGKIGHAKQYLVRIARDCLIHDNSK